MTYYVAINAYRSATDHGFVNTWRVYRCHGRAHQHNLLTVGLPTHDGGKTTLGVRRATRAEIRRADGDGAGVWGRPDWAPMAS